MIIAKWASGFENFYKGISAQTVAEEILAIGEEATPAQILEKAAIPESELHKCFTWDNSVAAEKWRLQEARQVVRLLVVDNNNSDTPSAIGEEIRIFHKTSLDYSSGYKSIELIVQDKEEYQKLLKRAKIELIAFKNKYKKLSELKDVFDAIEQLSMLE